ASVVRQTGSITIGQVGTGGQAENGQGHKPGIKTGGEVAEVQIRQGQQRIRQKQEQECRIQGPIEKHTPRPRLQVWPSLKYTCIISFRCLAGCRLSL
ncbi:unnamed protein product, partial [Staurois parvus]